MDRTWIVDIRFKAVVVVVIVFVRRAGILTVLGCVVTGCTCSVYVNVAWAVEVDSSAVAVDSGHYVEPDSDGVASVAGWDYRLTESVVVAVPYCACVVWSVAAEPLVEVIVCCTSLGSCRNDFASIVSDCLSVA